MQPAGENREAAMIFTCTVQAPAGRPVDGRLLRRLCAVHVRVMAAGVQIPFRRVTSGCHSCTVPVGPPLQETNYCGTCTERLPRSIRSCAIALVLLQGETSPSSVPKLEGRCRRTIGRDLYHVLLVWTSPRRVDHPFVLAP